MDRRRAIGRDGRLPWHLPGDLQRFKALTMGHHIIMGRKTWESLPRALPQRQNIVVTRQHDFIADGAEVVHSFAEALARVRLLAPVFCIGGGELYVAALPLSSLMYLTEIDADFEGDVRFPAFDRHAWRVLSREEHVDANGMRYAFVTYQRIGER